MRHACLFPPGKKLPNKVVPKEKSSLRITPMQIQDRTGGRPTFDLCTPPQVKDILVQEALDKGKPTPPSRCIRSRQIIQSRPKTFWSSTGIGWASSLVSYFAPSETFFLHCDVHSLPSTRVPQPRKTLDRAVAGCYGVAVAQTTCIKRFISLKEIGPRSRVEKVNLQKQRWKSGHHNIA